MVSNLIIDFCMFLWYISSIRTNVLILNFSLQYIVLVEHPDDMIDEDTSSLIGRK
jgi:hypothetical protein